MELSCDDFSWGPEKEVVVGDLGAPKVVINESTMQGVSVARVEWQRGLPLFRPILLMQEEKSSSRLQLWIMRDGYKKIRKELPRDS